MVSWLSVALPQNALFMTLSINFFDNTIIEPNILVWRVLKDFLSGVPYATVVTRGMLP